MTNVWLILLLSTAAAFADTLGGALTIVRRFDHAEIVAFTSIGAGFLLGATMLDRVPSALQTLPRLGPVFVLLGYLLVFLLEVIRQCQPGADDVPLSNQGMNTEASAMAFASMLVHTFMDGVVIAGSLHANRITGLLMFVAITLHKIPEGLTVSAISLNSSSSRRRAFLWAFSLTISSFIGAILTLLLGAVQGPSIKVMMALATGTLLFISTSYLVPYVRTEKQPRNAFLLFLGCGVFYFTFRLVQHVGLR